MVVEKPKFMSPEANFVSPKKVINLNEEEWKVAGEKSVRMNYTPMPMNSPNTKSQP